MMKNMEWGAVAYLKQSKYGLGTTDIAINDNSSFYTGGGTSDAYKTNVAQSTTGNIYGVYDMSGGAVESVMGNYNDIISMAGFSSMPAAKYYDKYTSSTGKTGDATTVISPSGFSIIGSLLPRSCQITSFSIASAKILLTFFVPPVGLK